MLGIKRYNMPIGFHVYEHPNGEFVDYADVAAMAEIVEAAKRLRRWVVPPTSYKCTCGRCEKARDFDAALAKLENDQP